MFALSVQHESSSNRLTSRANARRTINLFIQKLFMNHDLSACSNLLCHMTSRNGCATRGQQLGPYPVTVSGTLTEPTHRCYIYKHQCDQRIQEGTKESEKKTELGLWSTSDYALVDRLAHTCCKGDLIPFIPALHHPSNPLASSLNSHGRK